MKTTIDLILGDAIDAKVFPCAAVAAVVNGTKNVAVKGTYTYDTDSTAVTEQSVFDVASITKAIPVSCLMLKLIEQGDCGLTDQLITYVPEFTGAYREKITIHHLLTQTLQFNFRLSDCKVFPAEEIMKRILAADLQCEPGTTFSYANATSILLGMVIERCTGKDLETLAQHCFFEPLAMKSTSFRPEKFASELFVPAENDNWRGRVVRGEVHDESAWALRPKIVGSAGLFSTITDLSNFLEMLVHDGEWNGTRFFSTRTMALMHTNQLPQSWNDQTGLGWELNQKESMGVFEHADIFGKTGFTGCSIAVNPSKKAGYILLSNHLYPQRRANRCEINAVRRKLAGILLV